jgi:putative aldouronate transport system permease protein
VYQVVITSVVLVISLTAFFPLFNVVVQSFVSEAEWVRKSGIVLWVNRPILNGYQTALKNPILFRAFFISVIRSVSGTALGVFWAMITGFAVSRKDMIGRNILITLVLVTFLFGGGLIPTYLVVFGTGIYNTFLALIIPGMIGAWNVLVFKQFFENIPGEIEESAEIDGAGQITIAFKLFVPMSKPVIAALSLFTAVALWNDWFTALVFTKEIGLRPFMLYMRNIFNLVSNPMAGGQLLLDPAIRSTPVSVKMAVTVVGIVPIMCVYPFLQRYFIKGVYTGSVKA